MAMSTTRAMPLPLVAVTMPLLMSSQITPPAIAATSSAPMRPIERRVACRNTIQAAERSMQNLDAVVGDARPGVQALTKQTIPEVGQLVRDLRATTESLRSVTERLDREGALSIMRGQKLPDYEPSK